MSDETRKVPTAPGWWLVSVQGQRPHITEVCHEYGEPSRPLHSMEDDGEDVRWGGFDWIREFRADDVPKAEADALRERAATLEAWLAEERDNHVDTGLRLMRHREAVGRLREALSGLLDCYGYHDDQDDDVAAVAALAATTDEAIQGYDEPPEPDAVLVAKANAALMADLDKERAMHVEALKREEVLAAEVAELRAELAAERGEAEGALPGWRAWGSSPPTWCMGDLLRVALGPEGWRGISRSGALLSVGPLRSARAAMRAAEAEARRLGLLKEEP